MNSTSSTYRSLGLSVSGRFLLILFVLVAFLITPARVVAMEYGLNCGAPIIASTGQITGSTNPDVMKATGAQWVRVNFILGPWSAPDDTTPHGPDNLSWYQTYDRIIDDYISRGIQVYGLIGAESVKNASRDRLNTEGFVSDYTTATVKIIGHFRDRVTVYEGFNEPNDWAGGTSAQVEPYWFARYTESIFRAVKMDNGHDTDPSWQAVKLITGPLFTHDLDPGGPYLAQVFQAGTTQLGWNEIKQQTGTYPFNGVGVHLYVQQGTQPDSDVIVYLKRNLNSMWSALTALDGVNTTKELYISEFGWNSAYVSEQVQASKMDTAFNVFEGDNRIAMALWFTLTDWGSNNHWGIYRQEPYTIANRKPAYDVFVAHASRALPRDDAAISSFNVPVWIEPGEPQSVKVTLRNSGTTTWLAGSGTSRTWSLAAGRITAGFPTDNTFTWNGFGEGGTSVSPTEQYAWLGNDVAPGGSAAFTFLATAPVTLPRGPKPFVAGLWKQGQGLVGTPVPLEPLVVFRNESLTTNGDFETGDLSQWSEFGQFDGVESGPWFAGISASHGTRFAGSAANYGQKNGGLYQQFDAVPGGRYGATVEVQTYREGGSPGDTACRIGIDPNGRTDPNGTAIEWSGWTENQGEWVRIASRTTAVANHITVFLQAHQAAPTWNVTAFDDVIAGGPTSIQGDSALMVH